ncbi:MAG: hypothetical protein BGO70_03140 [Bacteroidetes bacterium 43-93]|nr:hypothetical protein [Bacteroidota bacterium]OJW98896.1 MAG: hypothetical protein BGO70_03140 [Bacteroidetes bacterium 43-93]
MNLLRKVLVISFLLCGYGYNTYSQNVSERIGIPGPLTFANDQFSLAWSDKPDVNYYVQEYLPKGQDPDHFKQMLAIHLLKKEMTVDDAVAVKVAELNNRKKTDPVCHYKLMKSPDGKEMILDCLLGESVNDKMTVVEFIIYRYKQVQLGDSKGILLYAYSKRSYGDDITAFLRSLGDTRINDINTMIGAELPVPNIKE